MKNQMEFHHMYTDDAFSVDPEHIIMFTENIDGATIHLSWEGKYPETAFDVSESYETVKRKLADFHKPLENISGWPYGE